MSEADDDEDMAWRDAVPMVDPVRQQQLERQTLLLAQMRAQQMYLEHGGMFSHGQHWQAAQTLCGSSFGTTNPAYAGWPIGYAVRTSGGTIIGSYCASTPVEDAGIRAGEIVGYRCWLRQRGGSLHSLINLTEWPPDGIMRGDPDNYHGYYGVHAFKTAGDVRCQYGVADGRLAFGRVALWGIVVEHELGYRAEFAKIIAIDEVNGAMPGMESWVLRKLRRHYGLTGHE